MFKKFDEASDIIYIPYPERQFVTLSNDSPLADRVSFFTGIRSFGTILTFDINFPSSLALRIPGEIKYQWNFDKTVLLNTSLTSERMTGIYLSPTADQSYSSPTNSNSLVRHQSVFNHIKGYLYRPDNNFVVGTTALNSSSSAESISIARLITIQNSLFQSSIQPASFKMEMNISNTSTTGIATGASTAFVAALDLKNPDGGQEGTSIKSFFGVPWTTGTSLDTATSAITVEAIVRPYKNNSVILWRRLSSSGWSGTTTETQNAFMKFELTKSPDNRTDAFRFYIRSTSAVGDFAEDFAKNDVQASGLFVPSDVGINLFDGQFHHLIVSWSCTGIDGSTTIESGAGAVFGYIDGYKLTNVEQTDPRLEGSDSGKGPTIQANMFNQRIPIRRSPIEYTDPLDATPSGNNLFIGISNFNRTANTVGDRGPLTTSADPFLVGGFDGQIQHLRIWNKRFNDGSTGLLSSVNRKVSDSSSAGISFNYFANPSLTGAALSSYIIAWWNFNERNTSTADDVSMYSNSGSLVGRSSINLYDVKDKSISSITLSLGSDITNSGITRNFLYTDVPDNNVLLNDFNTGRIIRLGADGTVTKVGVIFYDLGSVVLDGRDTNAKLDFLYPTSGTTGDWGFSVTANGNSALNVERIAFKSVENKGRMLFNAITEGSEFNYTRNPAGVNPENASQLLDEPTTYVTTIGLHDDEGNLLAVAKLSKPVKKDSSRRITYQVKMDV